MYLKIFRGNHLQEIGREIDQTVEIETIQEITTRIEIKIEGTVETTTEIKVEMAAEIEIDIEIGLTQEMKKIEERISKDLEKVKDTLTIMNFVTTVTEQVIQHHRCHKLENYLKRKGKKIILPEEEDVQELAQVVQDLNTKLHSLKVRNSTNF